MKEIDSQLYGYSYELDTTSESDGTKCFAVDTGTVFAAYKGVWYEQPGSFWAASISEGEDDLFKTSWEINKIVPASDLLIINAVDTGKRYVSFNGKWYAQPVAWSAPAAGGGGAGLPDPTEANEGDVLTVDSGEWTASAPVYPYVEDLEDTMGVVLSSHSTMAELYDIYVTGRPIIFRYAPEDGASSRLLITVLTLYTEDVSSGNIALVYAMQSQGEAVVECMTNTNNGAFFINNPFSS